MDKENKISRHPEASTEGSLLCHCERSVPQATPTGGPVRDERSEHAISYGLPRAHALAKTESGRSASFCHSCQAQRERESMPRQARHDTIMLPCRCELTPIRHCERSEAISDRLPRAHTLAKTEVGRSMVEMLGVLAIIGIVGMVGVKMYNMAMNKHHANTLIEQAQRRAVSAASQINLMGHAPSLADFSENTFGGGTFGGVTQEGLYQQFGIQVSGVSKPVCENILNSIGETTPIRRLAYIGSPTETFTTCGKNNTFLLIYNNDMSSSVSDISYCDNSTCQTVCGQCIQENGENKCVNECPVTPTQCTQNSQCSGTCVGCVIPEGETQGTCQTCQPVEYLKSSGTQYINTLFRANNTSGLQAQFSIPSNNRQAQIIVGSRIAINSTTKGRFWIDADWASSKPGILWGFNTYGKICPISDKIGQKVTASLNYMNDRKGLLDGVLYDDLSTRGELEAQKSNVYIFSCGPASGNLPALTKVYFIRISDNNTLVRDFVPVLDPWGIPAMFDRVNNQLYYNAGTGTFKTNKN